MQCIERLCTDYKPSCHCMLILLVFYIVNIDFELHLDLKSVNLNSDLIFDNVTAKKLREILSI